MSPSRPAFIVDSPLHWEVSDELFAKYRDLIYREAGIALTDQKKSLLISRLAGRLRELGLASFDAYYRVVEDPPPSRSAAGFWIASVRMRPTSFGIHGSSCS